MSDLIQPLYHLTAEQYELLLESKQGVIIYGSKFPANVNIFKSEKARYEAVMQLYHVVANMTSSSGASAEDVITFILDYADTITDVAKDIDNGLITDADIKAIVNYLEGSD